MACPFRAIAIFDSGGFVSRATVDSALQRSLAASRLTVPLHGTHLDVWLAGVSVFKCGRLHASAADTSALQNGVGLVV